MEMRSAALKRVLLAAPALIWMALAIGCIQSHEEGENGASAVKTSLDEGSRRKWEKQDARDYSFHLFQGCLCVPHGWSRVEVKAGTVVRVDSIPGLIGYLGPVDTALTPTMDGLFEIIERASRDSNFKVRAEYDPERGYPRSVRIDYVGEPHLYDAGFYAEVKELKLTDLPEPPKPR